MGLVNNPGCLQVVDPATYAVPSLSKSDYTNYPIISISNLEGFNTGNSVTVNSTNSASEPVVTVTDEHAFLAALFSLPYSLPKTVTTIGAGSDKAGTGYAALVPTLDGSAAGGATKPAKVVTNCVLQ